MRFYLSARNIVHKLTIVSSIENPLVILVGLMKVLRACYDHVFL